jgi:hypothetical protein
MLKLPGGAYDNRAYLQSGLQHISKVVYSMAVNTWHLRLALVIEAPQPGQLLPARGYRMVCPLHNTLQQDCRYSPPVQARHRALHPGQLLPDGVISTVA